jgi:hypothetical protein
MSLSVSNHSNSFKNYNQAATKMNPAFERLKALCARFAIVAIAVGIAWKVASGAGPFIGSVWPAFWEFTHRPEFTRSRTIYVAEMGAGPCEKEPEKLCNKHDKDRAVIKLRLPTTLYDGEPVYNGLRLKIYMDASVIRPRDEVARQRDYENLLQARGDPQNGGVSLAVSDMRPRNGASAVEVVQERLRRVERMNYVVVDSPFPGFTMLDRDGCQTFETTRRGIPNKTFPSDARFDDCIQRVKFLIPDSNSTAVISFIGHGDFVVSDYYEGERIGHSFHIQPHRLQDGSWKEMSSRIKNFILSFKEPG